MSLVGAFLLAGLLLGFGAWVVPVAGQAPPANPPGKLPGDAGSARDDDAAKPAPDPFIQALAWREVGPYRGGRAAAVAGIPGDPLTYYFGACGGGVWKTTDGGQRWHNVSDGFFGGSIGAIAVAPSDPNVVYVGQGEVTVRGNVSSGGERPLWKSTDAGHTWTDISSFLMRPGDLVPGDARRLHIPRIRVDPRDPNRVYVAVLGRLYGPGETRGVYRSIDGGQTFTRIKFVSPRAGCVDLALDPTNPRILYAAFWQVRRTPYSFESGGPDGSLWKSTDGGDTWKDITRSKGLPAKGVIGIAGFSISRANPNRIYLILEHERGGVFRSDDRGKSWRRTSDSRNLRQRAWYYSRIYADPVDADTVYVLNVGFWRSKDGGKTFAPRRTPHSDNHDLWIAPENPKRMIEANDGGANVSTDGGRTWTRQDNQPTAQIYRVATDNAYPYRIYGAQQDNSSLRIRHRSEGWGGIGERDWEPTAGGESGWLAPHPKDPEIVYGGSYGGYLQRRNHRTGERRNVSPWPDNPMGWGAAALKERFQWNFPIVFSPHDPGVLYTASQHLFKTTNEGQSWTKISPDLTRHDPKTLGPSGGPITKDNTSVEYYGTIFCLVESPHTPGVIWTGSDDGLVQLTRDGGASWTNVTPKSLPEWAQINSIEADPFRKGAAYVAATRYKSDDFTPYLFRTTDFGATWARIDAGIPREAFTRVVRADRRRPGLLYAGTEQGVFLSFDDGKRWQSLQRNLPSVPITDLALKHDDLIAATQGRGFWVLDDLSALQQLTPAVRAKPAHLFVPRVASRLRGGRGRSGRGSNPAGGAWIFFAIGKALASPPEQKNPQTAPGESPQTAPADNTPQPAPAGNSPADGAPAAPTNSSGAGTPAGEAPAVTLELLDSAGAVIRTLSTQAKEKRDRLAIKPGLNRFVWDMRMPGAETFKGLVLWGGGTGGPRVVPGRYQVRLSVAGGVPEIAPLIIAPDPRTQATPADYRAQFDFLIVVRDTLTRTHRAIKRLRALRSQLRALVARLGKKPADPAHATIVAEATAINKELTAVEEALYQTKNRAPQDPLNFPIKLNNKLAALASVVGSGDNRPTEQAEAVRQEITAAIEAELAKLGPLFGARLHALNAAIRAAKIPLLAPPKTDDDRRGNGNDSGN